MVDGSCFCLSLTRHSRGNGHRLDWLLVWTHCSICAKTSEEVIWTAPRKGIKAPSCWWISWWRNCPLLGRSCRLHMRLVTRDPIISWVLPMSIDASLNTIPSDEHWSHSHLGLRFHSPLCWACFLLLCLGLTIWMKEWIPMQQLENSHHRTACTNTDSAC